MDEIEYSTRTDCPGRFFRCQKMSATLSVDSCSRMWKEANSRRRDPCDRLHHCQQCSIGAAHSGVNLVVSSDLYGVRICSRCHRLSPRLIGDEYCPSCYNRQREVLVGANGKGTKPVKHPPLEVRRVIVANAGRVIERVFKQTTDTSEIFVSVLRHAEGTVAFGFRSSVVSSRPRPVQMVLPI